jgi:hypothetical protein
VFGTQPGFPGSKIFRTNLNLDVGHEYPIHRSLEDPLGAALQIIKISQRPWLPQEKK